MKVVTSTERVNRHRERISRSKPLQRLLKASELVYLRHRQQEVYTRLFVGRIERLLLTHPKFHKRFENMIRECKDAIRSAPLVGKLSLK